MSDMISRADAIAALMEAGLAFGYGKAVDAIRALPAVEVGARELEWRKVAPHGLHEAYGLCWKYQIREGTDAIVRWQAGHMGAWFEAANVDTAKAAAQADYAARIRSALTAAPAQDVAGRPDAPCTIVEYTNYRGETARRVIIPIRFWWGATEWHSDDQWMLTAYDVEKGAWRDFAWQDMRPVQNPATSAALARMTEAGE